MFKFTFSILLLASISIIAPSPITSQQVYVTRDKNHNGLHKAIFGGESVPKSETDLIHSIVNIEVIFEEGTKRGRCTGAVISSKAILTAAHCISKKSTVYPDDITIIINNDRYTDAVSHYVAHEDFYSNNDDWLLNKKSVKRLVVNDIAIIFLKEDLTKKSLPITTPTRDMINTSLGTPVIIAGYGRTSDKNKGSRGVLRWATVNISSYSDKKYRFKDQTASFCIGDSGGPALVRYGDNYMIVGILIESICDKGRGSILSFIDYYAWIKLKISDEN